LARAIASGRFPLPIKGMLAALRIHHNAAPSDRVTNHGAGSYGAGRLSINI